jgi:hypothetical protein
MLATIRMAFIKYKLGAFMATLFMMASCSEEMTGSNNIDRASLSARDYFRAVYFIDGPLAAALGEYKELSFTSFTDDKNVITKVRDFQDQVIAYISSKRPQFLDEFKQKITSGDYNVVRAAIKDGTKEYLEALNALSENRMSEAETSEVAEKYLSKYGKKKSISTAELVSNIKSFSKERENTEMRTVADPADIAEEKRMVHIEQYFWLYIDAAAAVVVIIVLILAAPEDGLAASNSLLSQDDSYVFEDYVSTITTNLAAE